MYKFILLVFAVLFVVIIANKPLFEKEETFKPKAQIALEKEDVDVIGEPLKRSEINSFLKVWPDYTKSWFSRLGAKQLSLTTSGSANKKIPYLTRAWINRRGWEVDRFFHVEERLRAIVTSLEAEDRAKKTIELLERQFKTESDSLVKSNIMQVIEYQKKLVNIEKVSRAERDMVRPYLEEISKILIEDGE